MHAQQTSEVSKPKNWVGAGEGLYMSESEKGTNERMNRPNFPQAKLDRRSEY